MVLMILSTGEQWRYKHGEGISGHRRGGREREELKK